MTVELRDLKWAVSASRFRSLRQAAEALNIRQSTLSRRLRDLELQLGVPLFERTNGGTWVTGAGQEFLEAARRIIDEIETITDRLKTRTRGDSGRLTVGVHAALLAGNFRATLVEHWRRYPEVELHMVDGSSDHLISDLAISAIDIAFVSGDSPGWSDRSLALWSERIVAAIPESHPLAAQEFINWSELKGEPLLLPQRGPGPEFLRLLSSKIGHVDITRIVHHDVALDRLLTLVGIKRGILLALEGATGGAYPGVTFREVRDAVGPTRLDFHAYWRQANCNPSLSPFLGMLRERYPDLSKTPSSL